MDVGHRVCVSGHDVQENTPRASPSLRWDAARSTVTQEFSVCYAQRRGPVRRADHREEKVQGAGRIGDGVRVSRVRCVRAYISAVLSTRKRIDCFVGWSDVCGRAGVLLSYPLVLRSQIGW